MNGITSQPRHAIGEIFPDASSAAAYVDIGSGCDAAAEKASLIDSDRETEISVAMCTYNGSRFVAEQLESIVAQTMQPDELVICDDGSTDGTIAIAERVLRDAKFAIRIERNEQRLGPSKNFEKALQLCRGKLILLSDQDDIWMTTKIVRIWEAFHSSPDALFAFSDAEIVDQQSRPVGRTLWDAVGLREDPENLSGQRQLEILLRGNIVTGAGLACRASLLKTALPIAPGWMHDHWMSVVGAAVSRGIPIQERLFMYRRHAGQVIGERKGTHWQNFKISMGTSVESKWQTAYEFQELLKRLSAEAIIGRCPEERWELLHEKEQHLLQRAMSRSGRMGSRFLRVLAEAVRGRYWRFSHRPCANIVRDLL